MTYLCATHIECVHIYVQVLIQKEWVWFGHPFGMRHSIHRSESGPIFLQFIDCVWQVSNSDLLEFHFFHGQNIFMVV